VNLTGKKHYLGKVYSYYKESLKHGFRKK
jgi:hypothetical protein